MYQIFLLPLQKILRKILKIEMRVSAGIPHKQLLVWQKMLGLILLKTSKILFLYSRERLKFYF